MKKVSWLLVLVMVFSMIAIGAVAEADKSAVSGEVNVYMASTEDFALAIKEGFEAAYPNITMNYVLLGGGEILTRLRAEVANPQADIVYGGACDNYMIIRTKGFCRPISPQTRRAGKRATMIRISSGPAG